MSRPYKPRPGAQGSAAPATPADGTLLSVARSGHQAGANESLLEIARRGSAVSALDQSSDNLQARLALAPPEVQRAHAALTASQRGSARSHTGASFQDDVNATARYLAMTHLGRLERHHPEFIKVPTRKGGAPEWRPKAGGAPCDYSGHVNASRVAGTLPSIYRLDRAGVRIPVVFDAKVAENGAAYTHEQERVHQLLSLREAAATRAVAFLLVYVRRIEAAVLIGPAHFDALIMGKSIPILEAMTAAEIDREPISPTPLRARPVLLAPGLTLEALPSGGVKTPRPVRLLLPAVPYTPGRGWDFAPALGYVEAQAK